MQVSVIIPVYNAASYVTQAVESALAQPETSQIVLVEDGSTDDSLSVCETLARRHPKIDLLRHSDGRNHGVAASRNLGIYAAQCEYVGFLDADDYYLPGRFRLPAEIMNANQNVDGVYEAIGTLYEDRQCSEWFRRHGYGDIATVRRKVGPSELFEALLDDNGGYFITDGLVVRSRVFERSGVFDTSLRVCEDTQLWLKMAVVGRLVGGSLHEPVGMRRLHQHNTTYQEREQGGRYAIKMARSLLVWGHREHLTPQRMILLLNLLLNFHLGEISPNTPYLLRKLKELWLFVRLAFRYPLILRSAHFRRVVAATVGWNRLKHLSGERTLLSVR